MVDIKEIFSPFINLFSREQLQAVLTAWLSSKLEPYFSGIITVDMFTTTLFATLITTLICACCSLLQIFQFRNSLTVQIEYYAKALSWIISQQIKELDKGLFIVQPANSKKERKFSVVFEQQDTDKNNNNNNPYPRPQPYYKSNAKLDVNAISEFISEITSSYFKEKEKNHKRTRYKRNKGYWHRVQYLSDLNGLERTGKTSLINAISSYLSQDLYHINLKDFKNNNEMSAAFSSVLPNQIIVLEDVDTQLNVLSRRGDYPNYCSFISEDALKEKDDLSKFKDLLLFISLSNFLECLDGQMLSEGTIIIMTTNHIEHFDPA
ncbi:37314_t:CDS:2 [Gigaspora margarita]|uniref:37314_t:CDS:1 n=1 Tax=Gigaspora margarita TaxID=4874 RepID=A0ABM8VXA3_GIGMA|nr:37314_t:CDS:2 [Gigaspora margarita]